MPHRFGHIAHQRPLFHGVAGNGVFPLQWWMGTNPDGVYLPKGLIMGLGKYGSILGRQHPSTVIERPFYQRVSGMVLALGFDVDD